MSNEEEGGFVQCLLCMFSIIILNPFYSSVDEEKENIYYQYTL